MLTIRRTGQASVKHPTGDSQATVNDLQEALEQLAREALQRWAEDCKQGNGSLVSTCTESYFQAVQLGYKGHQRQWRDLVLSVKASRQ